MITLLAAAFITLETGYQHDRIDATVEEVDTAFVQGYTSDLFQYTFSSYQLGGRGFFLSQNCFVWKGAGHYGWLFNGHYSDNDGVITGKLMGNTVDTTSAFGALVDLDRCFKLIPFVGFSYNAQKFQVKHSASFDPTTTPDDAEGAQWKSAWYGPWIGFDIAFDHLNVGYEFHYGRAKIHWSPNIDPAHQSFPYQVRLKNTFGHVFRIDACIPFCSCWTIGSSLLYSFWSNTHPAKLDTPPKAIIGLTPTQIAQMRLLSWNSFDASAILSLRF